MAADIDKLKAVVNRLTPLSTIASGDLIRAQDWNALVLALVDVARAVLAEAPTTVPPHEHLGQVKSEWLDPRLSTVIQRGPLVEPDAVARLTGAEHSVTAVDGRVTDLAAELGQLRLRLNEVTARDLDRASQVSSLGLRVSGINDARDDVQALRTTLTSVQDSLGKALAVAQQLTVNGKPFDAGETGQRLADLEKFREGLREPDGNLLDGSRLRADLQAATATLVSKDQLVEALAAHPTVFSTDQLKGMSDAIALSLRADFTAQFAQLGDTIRTETQQSLTGIQNVALQSVATEVGKQLTLGLQPVQASIADLMTKANVTSLGLTNLTASVGTVGQRVDVVAAADESARVALDKSLRAEMDARDVKTAARIDSSVNTLGTAVRQQINDTTVALRGEITRVRPLR